MSKKTELAKNTLIIGLGRLSTQFISFLLLPIYTLFLAPSDYGLIDLITTYVFLLVPIITIQLELAAFRFLVDTRGNREEKTKIISNVFHSVLSFSAVALCIAMIVNIWVNIPHFGLIAGYILATIFSSLLLQMSRGLGANKQFSIASLLTAVTMIVSVIALLVYARMGIEGVLISLTLANFVCGIYLFFTLDVYKYIKLSTIDSNTKKEIQRYSLPLVPNGIALWVISASDRTIIVWMIDAAANGIYAVASRFALALGSVSGIFAMSWTEAVSMHINSPDRDKFISETYNTAMRLFASLGLLLITCMPFVFYLLIDAQYIDAINYIPLLVLGVIFSIAMTLYGAIYVAKKLTRQVANSTILAAVINVILTIALIPYFGLYGSAIATMIAYLTVVIFRHYDLKKYVSIKYDLRSSAILAVGYALVFVCFYMHHPVLNIVSLIVTFSICTYLNSADIYKIAKKAVLKIKGLTK